KAACGPFTQPGIAASTSRLLSPESADCPGTIEYRSCAYNSLVVRTGSDTAAAIHLEGDAGNEFGIVGGEIERGVGDVARSRQATQRDRGLEPGTVLRRVGAHEGTEQWRLAGDRTERVDADIV